MSLYNRHKYNRTRYDQDSAHFASLLDNVATADTFDRTVEFFRAFSDSSDLADQIVKDIVVALIDSASLSDALQKTYLVNLSEYMPSTDNSDEVPGLGLLDTLISTDTDFLRIAKELAETCPLTDLASPLDTFLLKIEQVAISESILVTAEGVHVLLESLSLDEDAQKLATKTFIDFIFLLDVIDIRLPAVGFSDFVRVGEWMEIKFNEPVTWTPPTPTVAPWDKPIPEESVWTNPPEDVASFEKPAASPSTWSNPPGNSAGFVKPAEHSAPWGKPSEDSNTWTKPTSDNSNWSH